VSTVVEALDKLHTTAESHDRIMVCEVMGRDAGFIALYAGIAGTADVILIPEIPFDFDLVCEKIYARERAGRRFSIVVVAEGAVPQGGDVSILGESMPGQARRVGGIAEPLARMLQERTGKEARSITLGHLQRGGVPTGYDRLLSTRFGAAAVRAIEEEKWGHMVALQSPNIVYVPIDEVLSQEKRVEIDGDIVKTARELGVVFGD
jgi:6-phosphofructokinase 1